MATERRLIRTEDGRDIEFLTAGPDDGRSLVVHEGTPVGLVINSRLGAAAAERGLRIVQVARPGYEGSTPQPGRRVADIAKDEEFRNAGRRPLVADLPTDLVALYDRIRESSGGIGAALLRAGRCEGCRLELSGSERSEIRAAAPDDVVRHEECRRILVRTTESGL